MAAKERGARFGRPRLVLPAVARRIVRARDRGASFGAIAPKLTADAVLSPSGNATWQESTVRRIYAGAATPTPARKAG